LADIAARAHLFAAVPHVIEHDVRMPVVGLATLVVMDGELHAVFGEERFEHVEGLHGWLADDDFSAEALPEFEQTFRLVRLAIEIREHAGK
jgi:hypothetical protein